MEFFSGTQTSSAGRKKSTPIAGKHCANLSGPSLCLCRCCIFCLFHFVFREKHWTALFVCVVVGGLAETALPFQPSSLASGSGGGLSLPPARVREKSKGIWGLSMLVPVCNQRESSTGNSGWFRLCLQTQRASRETRTAVSCMLSTIFYILFRGPGLTKMCLSFKVTGFVFFLMALKSIKAYSCRHKRKIPLLSLALSFQAERGQSLPLILQPRTQFHSDAFPAPF